MIRLVEVNPEQIASQVRDRYAAYDMAQAEVQLSAIPIRTGRSELSVKVEVIWELAE